MSRRRRERGASTRGDGPPVPRQAWLALAACTGAATLLQIDGTLITVALPDLGRDLRVDSHHTAWLLTIYFLAYGAVLLPAGHVVDRIGVRTSALAGIAVFALGALVGALAPSFGVLLASRVLQGIGAGIVSPATLAGAVSGFPPERRGSALGIWGAVSGISNLIGPLLGGVLTVLFGWRANWWVLVPMAVAAAVGMGRLIPPGAHAELGDEPLAGHRTRIALATLLAMLTFVVMIGAFFLGQQYLQHVEHHSALGAALILAVVTVLVAVGAPLSGRLSDTHGEALPIGVGLALTAVGLALLGWRAMPLAGAVSLLPLSVFGLGLGMLFTPTSRVALNAVPTRLHGRISALLSAGRLVGGAIGSALAGSAIAGGVTTANVHSALAAAAAITAVVGLPLVLGLRRRPAGPAAAS